jgi:lipopolysaccharide/colanic/teichoic acid biosynthesis glycosyltransferase
MTKRIFDIFFSLAGLIITSPVLFFMIVIIWLQDFHSPFYIPFRVGKDGILFPMYKLRTMVVKADSTGVDSTSLNDTRVTPAGKIVRSMKLDELFQLINVIKGDMSLVGPRPNVKRETDIYTDIERKLLTVKPGITDISSIVFSDLAEIIKDSNDPNIGYNQLVRPWKSRLGLLYIDHMSLILDIKLIIFTLVAIISKKSALKLITKMMKNLGISNEIIEVCKREKKLSPYPPPGSDKIIESRN